MSSKNKFILGTRGSPLALVQARQVQTLLQTKFPRVLCEIQMIQTSGDRFLGNRLADAGGKGLFVKEIEEAMAIGVVDFAVHSLKDVPGILPKEFKLAAFLKREDPRDVFVSRRGLPWKELPAGSRIGTSSPRREVQLRNLRPDWEILPIRGNVDTRLRKVEEGVFDATVLAAAGLQRLGLNESLKNYFTVNELLPAVGQGIVAVEVRADAETLAGLLKQSCEDEETADCAKAERAFLAAMGGDCTTPLAGHATLRGDQLTLKGWFALPDGSKIWEDQISGARRDAEHLGGTLAKRILSCTS